MTQTQYAKLSAEVRVHLAFSFAAHNNNHYNQDEGQVIVKVFLGDPNDPASEAGREIVRIWEQCAEEEVARNNSPWGKGNKGAKGFGAAKNSYGSGEGNKGAKGFGAAKNSYGSVGSRGDGAAAAQNDGGNWTWQDSGWGAESGSSAAGAAAASSAGASAGGAKQRRSNAVDGGAVAVRNGAREGDRGAATASGSVAGGAASSSAPGAGAASSAGASGVAKQRRRDGVVDDEAPNAKKRRVGEDQQLQQELVSFGFVPEVARFALDDIRLLIPPHLQPAQSRSRQSAVSYVLILGQTRIGKTTLAKGLASPGCLERRGRAEVVVKGQDRDKSMVSLSDTAHVNTFKIRDMALLDPAG